MNYVSLYEPGKVVQRNKTLKRNNGEAEISEGVNKTELTSKL